MPDKSLHITVLGGGNIGTQFACISAAKGYDTTVFSSKPEAYDGTLELVDEFEHLTVGIIKKVTDNIGEALEDCDIAFVAHPAFQLQKLADAVLPYVHQNLIICVLPGTGGAEFAFHKCIQAGAALCGLQRVPSVARLERYGKRVRAEGLRKHLYLASIPSGKGIIVSELLTELFGIPCSLLDNYLSVTLTPSNPILHTTRLRTLFADYTPGKTYERNPLFYGEWSLDSSEKLIACDEELQEMCKLIPMDLTAVKSLKIHYESNTAEEMTEKLGSIMSLHNLRSPMKQVEGGWIPDFQSRYFTADFPYGLAIIEELADLLGVEAPNIRDTMNWYRRVTGDFSRLDLKKIGIKSLDDLCRYYY